MRRLVRALILSAALVCSLPAQAADAPVGRRVLIVSIDGLGPDVLQSARMPAVHGLMRRGSHTLEALTTELCNTLPSHVSMLTGVPPEVHGVVWNGDLFVSSRPPLRPTLFELARAAGFTTAMVAGKTKFVTLQKPGTLDWARVLRGRDSVVADQAVALIERHAPEVLFVHLPGVDYAGHTRGWGSDTQLRAAAEADRCVGRVLEALRRRGVLESTVVFVTADHGGTGRSHKASLARNRRIPWIVCGPGIQRNADLSASRPIRTEDTFATACWLLGIPIPGAILGRPIRAIAAPEAVGETTGSLSR